MIIINKKADFSQCGIGQLAYKVDSDVEALLNASFDNLPFELKLMFQQFINDIGGLNGVIYSKLKMLVIPAFAATIKECYTEVKSGNTFNPGGGAYYTYEGKVTLNRGVGANYEETATNALNFGDKTFSDGTCFTGMVCDGLQNYSFSTTQLVRPCIGYSNSWTIPMAQGKNAEQKPIDYLDAKVLLFNQGDTKADCLSYFSGKYPAVDTWQLPYGVSEFDLTYIKGITSRGHNWLNGGNAYPLATVKMLVLGDGLTRNQTIQLGNAMQNFYDGF